MSYDGYIVQEGSNVNYRNGLDSDFSSDRQEGVVVAPIRGNRREPKSSGTAATVQRLKAVALAIPGSQAARGDADPDRHPDDPRAEIKRLAELSEIDYALQRKSVSRRLEIPLAQLDRIVGDGRRDATAARQEKSRGTGSSVKIQTALELLVDDFQQYTKAQGIKLAFADGCWRVYRHGHWSVIDRCYREEIDRALNDLCPSVGLVFAKDAATIERHLRASRTFQLDISQLDQKPFIAVRNGTVDVVKGTLVEQSPEHMTTRFIEINNDPEARCPEWEQIIDEVLADFDSSDRSQIAGLIQEWMGVALAGGSDERTPRALRKILFLHGPPNSGKSTILDVVRALLGTNRIAAHTPAEVTHRFGLEAFLCASAWITDEVEDRHALSSSRIKCLATGEPVNVQRKGDTDVRLRFNGPIAWAGNTAPNFSEASGAIYDRILVVPTGRTFDPTLSKAKFGKSRPVEWLREKGELPGIFNWALAGYRRLLERGMFEDVQALRSAREEWRERNDPVHEFIANYTEPQEGVTNPSEVIAWAVLAYIKTTRSEKWPKLRTIQMTIKTAVAERYPDLKPRTATKRRIVSYDGLALTPDGEKYFRQAQQDNPAIEGLRVNQPPLLGPGQGSSRATARV